MSVTKKAEEFDYSSVIVKPGHFGFGFMVDGYWCPYEGKLKLDRPAHRVFTPVVSSQANNRRLVGMLDTGYRWDFHHTFCNGIRMDGPHTEYREPGSYGQGWIVSPSIFSMSGKKAIGIDDGYHTLDHLLSENFKLNPDGNVLPAIVDNSLVLANGRSSTHRAFMAGLLNHLRATNKWSASYACREGEGPWNRSIGVVLKQAQTVSATKGHIHKRFFAAVTARLTHAPRYWSVGLPRSRMTNTALNAWRDSWVGNYMQQDRLTYAEVHVIGGKQYVNRNSGANVRHYQIYMNIPSQSPIERDGQLIYKFPPQFGQKFSTLAVPKGVVTNDSEYVSRLVEAARLPAWSRALTLGHRMSEYPQPQNRKLRDFITAPTEV